MFKLILASSSPRRIELLKHLNLPFTHIAPLQEEVIDESLSIEDRIKALAYDKAYEIFLNDQDKVVLGADTVIVFEDEILGKPHTEEQAAKMLKRLQGKTHQVLTAVSIISKNKTINFTSKTSVTFHKMSDQEIKSYVDTKEPLDKAGAYTIQEKGAIFIKKIDGDFYTVMGLPIAKVYQVLKDTFSLYD